MLHPLSRLLLFPSLVARPWNRGASNILDEAYLLMRARMYAASSLSRQWSFCGLSDAARDSSKQYMTDVTSWITWKSNRLLSQRTVQWSVVRTRLACSSFKGCNYFQRGKNFSCQVNSTGDRTLVYIVESHWFDLRRGLWENYFLRTWLPVIFSFPLIF